MSAWPAFATASDSDDVRPLSAFPRSGHASQPLNLLKFLAFAPISTYRHITGKAIDPNSYHTMNAVAADLPHAIGGLDENTMAQVQFVEKSLDSIPH
jgi:hypothetical protein